MAQQNENGLILLHTDFNYFFILGNFLNTFDQPVEKVMAGDGVGWWWGCCNLLTYNEFITCFHESWIFRNLIFFDKICCLLWSVLNGFSFQNQNRLWIADLNVIFYWKGIFFHEKRITNRKFRIRENIVTLICNIDDLTWVATHHLGFVYILVFY